LVVGTKLGTANLAAAVVRQGEQGIAVTPSTATAHFFYFSFWVPGGTGFDGLLQLRILSFGLLQDGDVGVVFPQREESATDGASLPRFLTVQPLSENLPPA
jgi:hypothetical protein